MFDKWFLKNTEEYTLRRGTEMLIKKCLYQSKPLNYFSKIPH